VVFKTSGILFEISAVKSTNLVSSYVHANNAVVHYSHWGTL
jgi:hypothetical protein